MTARGWFALLAAAALLGVAVALVASGSLLDDPLASGAVTLERPLDDGR